MGRHRRRGACARPRQGGRVDQGARRQLAALLTSEQGKPVAEARGEVTHLAHGVRYYAEAATKVRGAHQELASTLGRSYGMVIRRPMGVCAAITPYNFPLTLLGTKVAPALATGNTVVAKPASTTPLATLEVARLFAEAGVPDGVLNVVTGRGATIGDALVGHPDVRRIAFTGETATGRHLMSIAGPALKRVTLELGGSDPVIMCADADVDAAVKAVIIGRYWNAGQACLGCKRVFVADAVYDDFASQLVDRVGRYEPGDGTVKAEKPRLRMGPIHTRRAATSSSTQLEDGVAKGGELLIGGGTAGHDKGWFLEPAVVAEPGPTRAWSPRRSSAPCCRSSASPTSTRRSRAPTTRPTAWARRSGRTTCATSTARPRRSTPG